MIKAITVEIASGETLTMTLASPETSLGFAIVNCDGLGPGSATINGSDWVTIAGGSYESSHIPKRTINLELRYLPTSFSESVADIRRKTYKWFPLTKKIKLTFHHESYSGSVKDYYIEGYVERNEPNLWSEKEGCTISIVCFDPYFKNTIDEVGNFNQIVPLFHFEFPTIESGHPFPVSYRKKYDNKDILNNSTIETGAIFTLSATGQLRNPVIYSNTTRQKMELEYTMRTGEVIVFDTRNGKKNIYRKDADNTNMIKYLKPDSEFITMIPGINNIGIHCEDHEELNFMNVSYTVTPLHMGV